MKDYLLLTVIVAENLEVKVSSEYDVFSDVSCVVGRSNEDSPEPLLTHYKVRAGGGAKRNPNLTLLLLCPLMRCRIVRPSATFAPVAPATVK